MKTKPTPIPKDLHFGVVAPGDSTKYVVLMAHGDSDVTARIEGGNGKFSIVDMVRQQVYEVRLSDDEISQLPPKLRNDPRYHVAQERMVKGRSNGITPLMVKSGDELLITVKYHAATAPGFVADSSTLVIEGTNWESVSVPMYGAVGQMIKVHEQRSFPGLQSKQ